MAKTNDVANEPLDELLRRHREELGAKSMVKTNELEPLYAQRDEIMQRVEQLKVEAREINVEIKRIENDELAPLRRDHARISRALGGRGLGDNPA